MSITIDGSTNTVTSNAATIAVSKSVEVTGTMKCTTGAAVGGATPGTGGVAFPATAVAVADANTLDDYEEGNWTGAMVCGTSGTITLYTSWQTGRYIKVGNQVSISGFFRAQSISSPVGALTLTGLPFACANNSQSSSSVAMYMGTLQTSATGQIVGIINQGGSFVGIAKYAAGVTSNTMAADIGVNDGFYINCTYFV